MLKMRSLHRALMLGAAVMCFAPSAQAAFVVQNDTSFSYVGTITNPAGLVSTIPSYTYSGVTYTGRDASLFFTSDAPISITGAGYQNSTMLNTAWFPTLTSSDPAHPQYGWGNPNNTNTGFFQYYDETNHSITLTHAYWDSTKTQFTLHIKGAGLVYPGYDRVWDAPNTGGPASDTGGEFQTFDLSMVTTFAAPATEEFTGWYSTTAAPISVNGTVTGTFLNESPNTALNGVYGYDLTFQGQNWARDVGASWASPSYFGAAVPEPAEWALLLVGFGLIGLALRSRREGIAVTA